MKRESDQHLPYRIDENANKFHYYENLWKRNGLDLAIRALGSGAGYRLLDIGCGRGEMLDLASRQGFKACGCDIDPTCVSIAAQYGKTWQLESETDLDKLETSSFDVVTCMHVLEHVENPKRLLQSIARISRDLVLLAVPNLRTLAYLRFRPNPVNLHVNARHLQGWDHETFLNLAVRHANLEFLSWGFDATMLPGLSRAIEKLFGNGAVTRCETGLFRKLFPFHGLSCIGLFRKKQQPIR